MSFSLSMKRFLLLKNFLLNESISFDYTKRKEYLSLKMSSFPCNKFKFEKHMNSLNDNHKLQLDFNYWLLRLRNWFYNPVNSRVDDQIFRSLDCKLNFLKDIQNSKRVRFIERHKHIERTYYYGSEDPDINLILYFTKSNISLIYDKHQFVSDKARDIIILSRLRHENRDWYTVKPKENFFCVEEIPKFYFRKQGYVKIYDEFKFIVSNAYHYNARFVKRFYRIFKDNFPESKLRATSFKRVTLFVRHNIYGRRLEHSGQYTRCNEKLVHKSVPFNNYFASKRSVEEVQITPNTKKIINKVTKCSDEERDNDNWGKFCQKKKIIKKYGNIIKYCLEGRVEKKLFLSYNHYLSRLEKMNYPFIASLERFEKTVRGKKFPKVLKRIFRECRMILYPNEKQTYTQKVSFSKVQRKDINLSLLMTGKKNLKKHTMVSKSFARKLTDINRRTLSMCRLRNYFKKNVMPQLFKMSNKYVKRAERGEVRGKPKKGNVNPKPVIVEVVEPEPTFEIYYFDFETKQQVLKFFDEDRSYYINKITTNCNNPQTKVRIFRELGINFLITKSLFKEILARIKQLSTDKLFLNTKFDVRFLEILLE